MREVMLIAHFIGLAMSLGTSLAFMFLGIAASKMEKSESQNFNIKTFAISKMEYIGITLLVLSGGYLMTPYWKVLADMYLLIAKFSLVLLLIIEIFIIHNFSKKAKKGNTEAFKRIDLLGKVSLITTLAIVILAVSVFH